MQHARDIDFEFGTTRIDLFGKPRRAVAPQPQISVLNQPLWDGTTKEAIDLCLNGQRKTVFFLNAHCANTKTRHRAYAQALARADYVFPDGIGIEIAARMTGDRITTNLNGTDLIPQMLAEAGNRNMSVFLLGARPGVAEAAADKLRNTCPGLNIAGVCDGYDQSQNDRDTIAQINASRADILLVAMGVPLQELWIDRHRDALHTPLVMGVGALFDFVSGRVPRAPAPIRKARSEWLYRLCVEPRRMARRYLIGNATFLAHAARHAASSSSNGALTKRMIDVTLAGLTALVLSPIFLLMALAIRLDSHGPALFTQERIGKNGKPFRLYKFRTMHTDAEQRRDALLAQSDREGVCFKSRHDPRVTRVGRHLRRWSLDELPQILNVLRGDMSLVGPRPALPSEVAAYPPRAKGRLAVKPGITGIWQVSGRADIGFEKMVDMDIAYTKSRSLWLDIILIALTFQAVVSRRGAY